MQKVLTVAEMREVDRLTTEKYGIPSVILMENAAHAVVRVIAEKLDGSVRGKSVLVLCGKGNNGGDGAAVARILHGLDCDVYVILFGKINETNGDARTNFEYLRKLSEDNQLFIDYWEINELSEFSQLLDSFFMRHRPAVIVDAMFGTGLTRPLESLFKGAALAYSKPPFRREGFVVSVDVPSGLNADRNQPIGVNVCADVTVTFTAPKLASVLPPASDFNGELIIAEIGSGQELVDSQPSRTFVSEKSDVAFWLRKSNFSNDSYKNKRGHAFLIAGSENYSGAAVLCANAAIRSGVGLVTVGTPRSSKDSIAGRVVPEVMVRPLAETGTGSVSEEAIAKAEEFLDNVDAITIGSGLSRDESTGKFVRHFVENRTMPTILDADALTLLSPFAGMPSKDENRPPLILTPHQGEFLRLLGTDDKDAIKDRVAAVREFAQRHNVILVLKGERVLIGEPSGKVVVNPTGNSGTGKAGNGDTLTGIITGFAAQAAAMDIDMFETVVAAVYIAGLAGDIAERKFGKRVMTASDVRECLVEAFETVG